MMRPFNKSPHTFAQQITLLQSRGMVISDLAEAEFFLQHSNYYRLSAYWLPFESDHATHTFMPGTNFKDVLNLYLFDRQLRILVLEAIERIEVSVRSTWAYHLAHHSGPHSHLDKNLARKDSWWQENINKLSDEVRRSDETFIKHLTSTYSEPLPPIWAVCEIMSLGLLSRWYKNLKPMKVRSDIARNYNINEILLESWLHHLSLVRNTCAHHSRLWNREFTVTAQAPRNYPQALVSQWAPASRRLYNSLVILLYFMDILSPNHNWKSNMKSLLSRHNINVSEMGFPITWQTFPLWL